MYTNNIEVSPLKQQLRLQYEQLQREYAALVVRRDEMIGDEKPRLEALYMEYIGQLLYQEMALLFEICLLEERRDLLQAYINRGQKPDNDDVDRKVNQQAEKYNEKLRQEEERINNAKAYRQRLDSQDNEQSLNDYMELKRLYRKLVLRLHPDLHPDQSDWERNLFHKVQKAYEDRDLERLRQLEQELDAGCPDAAQDCDIEQWQARIARLKEQIAAVQDEIRQLEGSFPFTYRQKLYDMEWVSAQQEEIRARISKLEAERDRLLKIIEILSKARKHGA